MAELFTLTNSKAVHVPATQTDQKKITVQGSTLYYKVTSDVNSGDSALTSGSSLTIAADYWIISAGTSKVLVDSAASDVAAEDVTVTDSITAASGTFTGALDADAITGTSLSVDGAAGIVASANGGKDTLNLSNTTANVGITIGGDTTLYRSAADTLKTDDALIVGGGTGRIDGVASPTLALVSSGGGTGVNVTVNSADTILVSEIGVADMFYLTPASELQILQSTGRIVFAHASQAQTTVGAAGAASALPATPTKYFKVKDSSGTELVIPAYAAS